MAFNLTFEELQELTPSDPEIIEQQATINIGTIGHVAHGKSTIVKAISGVDPIKFKEELSRNITIKLGYANAKIYKCTNIACTRPGCYAAYGSSTHGTVICKRDNCGGEMKLTRHISLTDCYHPETSIMMSDGNCKPIKDIKTGASVMGDDGTGRRVFNTQKGKREMYRIKYKTHEFTCTSGHILVLRIDKPVLEPKPYGKGFLVEQIFTVKGGVEMRTRRFDTEKEVTDFYASTDKSPLEFEITVANFIQLPRYLQGYSRLFKASALEFDTRNASHLLNLSLGDATSCDIAWLIGLWFANGSKKRPAITVCKTDYQIIDKIHDIATKAHLTVRVSVHKDKNTIIMHINKNRVILTSTLRSLNISNKKTLPNKLKFASLEIRRALLSGFIDGGGYYENNEFEIVQKHLNLARDIVWLSRSLGFSTRINQIKKGSEIHFNGDLSQMSIVLPRKQGTRLIFGTQTHISQPFTIEAVGVGDFVGFETDGNHRFLLADFVVGHNCPGHDVLMSTMLNGVAVMDAALLLIAGNQPCPQPQTSEHLAAIEIMRLKELIVLQNKMDLVTRDEALTQHKQIQDFIKGTVAENAPIIPICAQRGYNIDVLCEYLCKIPLPIKNYTDPFRLIVIRSFDVNKPGSFIIDNLKGGIAGGTILRGVILLGQDVEIRPGLISKDLNGNVKCEPLITKIISLQAEENSLKYAVPGGLIGVRTLLDPCLTRSNRLVGQLIGPIGTLPDISIQIEISFQLLTRLLGVQSHSQIAKLRQREVLMINIAATSCGCCVNAIKNDLAKLTLSTPVCASKGDRIAISRRIDQHWRLIGWGNIVGLQKIG